MKRSISALSLFTAVAGFTALLNAQTYTFQKAYTFASGDYPVLMVDLTSDGKIVGNYTNYATFSSAFIISNGSLEPLKLANTSSNGYIDAASGTKVLVSLGYQYPVYLYDVDTQATQQLSTPGYGFAPTGFNAKNNAVGTAYKSNLQGANRDALLLDLSTVEYNYFTYPNSTSTTLADINNAGTIVGTFTSKQSGNQQGFLLTNKGVATPITYPGSVVTEPISINNSGKVFGTYRTASASAPFVFDGTRYTTVQPPNTTNCNLGHIKDSGEIIMTCEDLSSETEAIYLGSPVSK